MRTTANKPISAQQLKALHVTFHRIGMDDEARHGCIYEFTSGRTESSRELTMQGGAAAAGAVEPDGRQGTGHADGRSQECIPGHLPSFVPDSPAEPGVHQRQRGGIPHECGEAEHLGT